MPLDDAAQYWIARGQQTFGPYTGAQVREYVASGNIALSDMLRGERDAEWTPVSFALGAVPPQNPGAAPLPTTPGLPGMTGAPSGGATPVSYVFPILLTICCCLIGGVISIVYAAQANTALARGDMAAYERHKKTCNTWMIVSLVVGVLGNLLVVGLQIAVAMAAPNSGGF